MFTFGDLKDYPEYFPSKAGEHENYKEIFVGNKKVIANSNFKVYVLEILPDGCSDSIVVNLVNYHNWTDRKAIDHETLDLLKAWKNVSTVNNYIANFLNCLR